MIQNKILILLIISLSSNLYKCVSNLLFDLQSFEEQCIYEYFSDKTLVIYSISSSSTATNLKITDPDNKTIETKVIFKIKLDKF